MGLTSGPRPFSRCSFPLITIQRRTLERRLQYSGYCTNTMPPDYFLLLFSFFFYSAVLVRLLRNSLSTKAGGAAAAAEALAIRGRAEKNVGCMPVGLCHFRRGLSQLFRAFLLGAELVSPAIGENPFLLDHGAPLAMKIHGAHTVSPLFLTRDIYWQVLCECFAPTSTKRDFSSPPGEIANSISHHFDRQSISLIKSSY